ncbi:hypothetical protein EB118_26065 [bacterium]|nr:hypothetical protein [bacterium]
MKLKIFEWLCSIVLLGGVALTSFNIFPLNLWVLFFGNLGWVILGWIWRKWSLIAMQVVITLIYVVGIIKVYW